MAQDVFGRRRITDVELLVQTLPPCIELADAVRQEKMRERRVNRRCVSFGRSAIDECVKNDLQVVRQRPSDAVDDQRSLLGDNPSPLLSPNSERKR